MSGPKRNPDKLNTVGIVVVGICGAVLVYVAIVALQAFYMNDTSEVQTMADYGGQDTAHQSLRATQINTIDDCGPNGKPEPGHDQTYRIPIKYAMKLVVDDAKVDPSNLVPTQGRSDKPTILPIFGRPKMAPKADEAKPASDATMAPTGGQGPGGGQPPGQDPASAETTPGSTPTEMTDTNKAAAPNPPTPNPKAGVSDPKGGTAAPKTPAPKGSAATPKQ